MIQVILNSNQHHSLLSSFVELKIEHSIISKQQYTKIISLLNITSFIKHQKGGVFFPVIYYLITAKIVLQKSTLHGFSSHLFMCIFEKIYPRIRLWIKATLPDLTRRKHSSIAYLKHTTLVGKVQKYNLSKSVKRTQTLITV